MVLCNRGEGVVCLAQVHSGEGSHGCDTTDCLGRSADQMRRHRVGLLIPFLMSSFCFLSMEERTVRRREDVSVKVLSADSVSVSVADE